MKTPAKRRQMIIVWKWTELEEHDLTDSLLEHEPELKVQYKAVDQMHDKLYKFYPVCEEGENSYTELSDPYQDGDRILITSINKGIKTESILIQLLRYVTGPDIQTYLFLHRGHNFGFDDVKRYLGQFEGRIDNCFLFHGRNDFIYYDTFNEGLLDNSGDFYEESDPEPELRISVLNPEGTAVKRRNFDRVWTYYSNELERKLFELRLDLITVFLPHLHRKSLRVSTLNQILATPEKRLDLRLRSLLGEYNHVAPFDRRDRQKREERQLLEKLEKEKGQSYTLDDWRGNIAHLENGPKVERQLQRLGKQIKAILYPPDEQGEIDTHTIRKIIDLMEPLMVAVPGEIKAYV